MATTEPTLRYRQSSRLLILYGLPLFLSTLLTGGVLQLYKFLMAIHVDTFSIGNYQAATNFSVIVAFFMMPISTVLFPLFSKFNEEQSRELSLVYQNAIKYASIITIPVVTALILFAEPVVKILYGGGYPYTAFYLKLYCINFLFIGVGRNCHANLIKGQGYPEVIFQNKVIDAIIGVPLSLLLIPRFGIIGLIFSSMISPKISLFRSIWWIYRKFGFTIMWESSIKIYLSSAVSFLSTYYVLNIIDLIEMYELIIGGTLFFFLYLILIIIFKTLDSSDIVDLRKILSSMGPFTKLFNIFLNILEKFINIEHEREILS